MNNAPETPAPVPAHIPTRLVRRFDLCVELPALNEKAYVWAVELHQTIPLIFWIPCLGFLTGIWVPRRAEDLRRILQDPQTLRSGDLTPYAILLGESWRLAPLEIGPPDHARYRALLNTLCTPKMVEALKQNTRQLAMANQLMDEVQAYGRCDTGASPHMAFSYGVHRCVGSHLAHCGPCTPQQRRARTLFTQ